MCEAAYEQSFMRRVRDVSAVLEQWNMAQAHALTSRRGHDKVGMAVQSFGAVTTQAVSDQSARSGCTPWTDARISAAVLVNPCGTPKQVFWRVSMPWLLMNGTHDTALVGGVTWPRG